jgi:hypothetical protein
MTTARVTFEEACHCPRCGQPGEERTTTNLGRAHGQMHYIYCNNQLCRWFNTPWMIQTLPDGTIPEREPLSIPGTAFGDLTRGRMSKDMEAMGRRFLEDALKRDIRGTELDK